MIFTDSCDHYLTSQIKKKWLDADLNAIERFGVHIVAGRKGKGLAGPSPFNYLNVSLPEISSSVWIGMAWKAFGGSPLIINNPSTGQFAFLESIGNGFWQIRTRDFKTAPINNFIYKQNVWYFLEINFIFALKSLTYTFRVNEELIATEVIGGLSPLSPLVTLANINFPCTIADVYIHCNGGLGFLGDCEIESLFVNSEGNWSDFDGTYQDVDDLVPDDAISIISTNIASEKHTVRFESITETNFNGTIPAVNIWSALDLGEIATFIWSNEEEVLIIEGGSIGTKNNYIYICDTRTIDLTNADWTMPVVNQLDCGMRYDA